MMLGTANIQNFNPDLTPDQVAWDAKAVTVHTTVCGLQEIQPHEDTPVVLEAIGHHWDMVGRTHETPIVYDARRWELLDHNLVEFHRPRLPRPQSAHGAVTSATFRAVDRRHLPPFAVVNTHLVANGMNGDMIGVIAERWLEEWRILHDEALRLWRTGLSVFVVGDLNNPRPRSLAPHRAYVWLSPQVSPDHLGLLKHPSSVHLETHVHQRVPLNSDHDLHVITGPLRGPDVPTVQD